MSALRVGLTGGLAAGKSTVAEQLAAVGFLVVDADQLVAELYRSGQPGAQRVADLFGSRVLDSTGAVDHAALAAIVFADDTARRELEAAVHPLVKERFDELAGDADGVAVLEGALLLEAGFADDFDLLVTVEADPAVRVARAVARGLDEAQARQRISAQTAPEARIEAADRVLWNNDSLDQLELQIDQLIGELRKRAEDVR